MDEEWNQNKAVGNIAENIVEMMINSMPDWKCMKFGVETHIKDIKDMVVGQTDPLNIKIRKMPDFVVFNERTGETFFIEVKYRSTLNKERYFFKYLENYKEYWMGTKLIIVRPTKPHFVCINLEEINDSMREMEKSGEEWKASWNFGEIKKEIQNLFPELEASVLDDAIKLIPNLKDE